MPYDPCTPEIADIAAELVLTRHPRVVMRELRNGSAKHYIVEARKEWLTMLVKTKRWTFAEIGRATGVDPNMVQRCAEAAGVRSPFVRSGGRARLTNPKRPRPGLIPRTPPEPPKDRKLVAVHVPVLAYGDRVIAVQQRWV